MKAISEFLNYWPWEYNHTIGVTSFILATWLYLVYNIAVLWNLNDIRKGNYKINKFPKSVSITYYLDNPRWLFKHFMWANILFIILIGQNLGFIFVGSMFFIMTANPSVNSGNIYFIPHMIGAISAITLGVLLNGICFNNWWIVIDTAVLLALGILFCKHYKSESTVYWIEHVSIIFGLFLGLFISRIL